MKRIFSIVICCLMVVSCGGCSVIDSDKPITITILMDVYSINSPLSENEKRNFQNVVNYYYPQKNIELEFILLTSDPIERQVHLANIRTEIMAGGGPDVFILPTWTLNHKSDEKGNDLGRNEPLFTDVEDAMRNRIFLSLNELIAESEHYKPEEHISTIMDAGVVDGNQYVMPLLFDYGLALVDRDYIGDSAADYNTYEKFVGEPIPSVGNLYASWIHYTLGEYIDYESEELKITENELSVIIEEVCSTWNKEQSLGGNSPLISVGAVYEPDLFTLHTSNGELVPIAVPDRNNGITANITAFAAVNANSEHPEEAFNIIELFYHEDIQDDSLVWIEELEKHGRIPFSSNADVGAGSGIKTGLFNYVEYNYPTCWHQIEDIHNRISDVKFISETDCLLYDVCDDLFADLWDGKEIDYQAIAAELYSDWKMMVAE